MATAFFVPIFDVSFWFDEWRICYDLTSGNYELQNMSQIEIFTDGGSSGNPGPGGYGAILRSGAYYKELSGGYRKTTNNRMELTAVIKALEALKKAGQQITVYSDSKYVIDAIEKRWLQGWIAKGFVGKKNQDLWMRYVELSRLHQIRFIWVKGHAGHPENERCDRLAVSAYGQKDLGIDTVFEAEAARASH